MSIKRMIKVATVSAIFNFIIWTIIAHGLQRQ
jgi:hypothetical protein